MRAYEQREIEGEIKDMLEDKIAELNGRSGLHIQLITHEPKAFDSPMAHYGKFSGVTDYIAMIGKKDDELEENAATMAKSWCSLPSSSGLTPAG